MSLLSIIIPAYNEEETIKHVMTALKEALDPNNINFEVIFVDDGSSDNTYTQIKEQRKIYKNVYGHKFSRNFGKEAAMWAGLHQAHGDCCIVMDCDLQHPPETLPKMYKLWEEGCEVVEGIKVDRGREPAIYKTLSNLFYKLITKMSGLDMRTSSDFKLLDRKVVDELLKIQEKNTFFRGLSFWIGFKSVKIEYEVAPRKFGTTKWNFFKLAKYAIKNIISFTTAPLQMVSLIGSVLILSSIILGIQTLIRFLIGNALEGFTTIIILLLLIGGAIMICLGIIGLYVAEIYEETKDRPRYIISESTEDYL